jgi:O-antigen ligase
MNSTLRSKALDRDRLSQIADWAAVAVAVSLNWSTSATSILVVVWLLALLPSMDLASLRRDAITAAGGLPLLLVLLGVAGMLWADVSWRERFSGLTGFHRLLMIPLLLAQFRRSQNGVWVLYGFFGSVVALLLTSWALVLIPGLPWRGRSCEPGALNAVCQFGVPVGDYIGQRTLFTICMFAAMWRALDLFRERGYWMAFGLAVLATLFLANMTFVVSGRTAIGVLLFFVLLFGWRRFGWKGVLIGFVASAVLAAGIWETSSYVQKRTAQTADEMQSYLYKHEVSSTGAHLEMLKESISFVREAPIFGHGTGSIGEMFRRAAVGRTGVEAITSVNPHNQILAVAIQLGLFGAVALIAMWIAHYCLFRTDGFIAWIGTVVVVENIVSSTFNSHLFDFMHGWLYVFGVGVVGGMVRRESATASNVKPESERTAFSKNADGENHKGANVARIGSPTTSDKQTRQW